MKNLLQSFKSARFCTFIPTTPLNHAFSLLDKKKYQEAFDFIKKTPDDKFVDRMYSIQLRCLYQLKKKKEFISLFDNLLDSNVHLDSFDLTRRLHICASRPNEGARALAVFGRIRADTSFTINASHYSNTMRSLLKFNIWDPGNTPELIRDNVQMLHEDMVTEKHQETHLVFNCLLEANSLVPGSSEIVSHYFQEMQDRSFIPNSHDMACLIAMKASDRKYDDIEVLLKKMKARNFTMTFQDFDQWIRAAALHDDWKTVWKIRNRMKDMNVDLSNISMINLFEKLVRADDPEATRCIHNALRMLDMTQGFHICTGFKALGYAKDHFEEIRKTFFHVKTRTKCQADLETGFAFACAKLGEMEELDKILGRRWTNVKWREKVLSGVYEGFGGDADETCIRHFLKTVDTLQQKFKFEANREKIEELLALYR